MSILLAATNVFGSTAPAVFQEFTSTGLTNYTIPAGVNTLRVRAWGSGGGSSDNSATDASGAGGFVETLVDVSGLASIDVYVATGGASSDNGAVGVGIGNGGQGSGGGSGGAGSGVRTTGGTVICVAGGGGGRSADQAYGGGGGGITGQNAEGIGGPGLGGSTASSGTGAGTGGVNGEPSDTFTTDGGDSGTGNLGGGNGGAGGGGGGAQGGAGGGGGWAGGGGGGGGNDATEGGGGGGSGYANPTYCSSNVFGQSGQGTTVSNSGLLPTGGTGSYASGTSAINGSGLQGVVVIDNDGGAIS